MLKLRMYSFIKHIEGFSCEEHSTLYELSKIYMPFNTLNDRFGILTKDSEYNILSREDDIHIIKSLPNISFEECCRKRTDEIIDLAISDDKHIYVSFSGGVDSTCIVCSFLMNERLDKSRFHLLYNEDSYSEYPLFFDLMKKEKVNCIDIHNNIFVIRDTPQTNIVVNGLCGDQLDGSNLSTKKYVDIDYFSDWKDVLQNVLMKGVKNLDKHISNIEEYAKYFEIDLKFFGQFAWMFNYSLKWDYVANYMKCIHHEPKYSIAFFDTPYFSHYGWLNSKKSDKFKQSDNYHYKTDWKKVIYKYTKDMNYFLYKGKDARFMGGEHAYFGMALSDNTGWYMLPEDSLRETMLKYIKPEYHEYYTLRLL